MQTNCMLEHSRLSSDRTGDRETRLEGDACISTQNDVFALYGSSGSTFGKVKIRHAQQYAKSVKGESAVVGRCQAPRATHPIIGRGNNKNIVCFVTWQRRSNMMFFRTTRAVSKKIIAARC